MKTKLSIFSEKIIEAGWLAALVAVPLFFNIYSARTFEPDKITLMRSITGVMILAWLVLVVEQGRLLNTESGSLSSRFKQWLKQPMILPTLFLVVVYIISTILSISPSVSLWGSYQRLQGSYSMLSYIVIFAMIVSTLRSKDQVDRLITIVIVASIPVGLYGIIQRYGLDPLPWAGDVTRRVASNMGNAIFVASYLIMIIPLTISRLISSMTAIVREEQASWGQTILSAVYIFALAVQAMTVIFSQSRGPMLGVLGAGFVMGLLFLLLLRRFDTNKSGLSVAEIATGIGFLLPLGLSAALGGSVGYFIGLGLENLLAAYQLEQVSLLGAVIGSGLGFLGAYTLMAATNRGWRWLWISWLGTAVLAIAFVITLNLNIDGLNQYLEPVRDIPYVSRLSQIMETEGGSGKVRLYIWDSAIDLITPHQPLGIEGDPIAREDTFNFLRPLFGYGPESMFNAFAYVYPPGLAHVEARGSSADRSHNETMDSLVMTGLVGFVAFYLLMGAAFFYSLRWLGWVPNRAAAIRLIAILGSFSLVGALIPYFVEARLTFMPVGLPFGLMAGVVAYLMVQGFGRSQADDPHALPTSQAVILIGLLGALIGHFIEVHFVFSIAATYTYFWAFLGLIVALPRVIAAEKGESAETEAAADTTTATEEPDEPDESTSRRSRRSRRRSRRSQTASPPVAIGGRREGWETWLGSQGLSMAIILIILTFDFVTPQFEFSLSNESSASFFWIIVITWLVGAAIALSNLAIRVEDWRKPISWGRAVMLYSITSLSYFFFYAIVHRAQFAQRITVTSIDDVITAASVLTNGLIVFYIFLLLLMAIIAVMLSWGQNTRGLAFWRSENWWLYPPLALAVIAVIWFQNINVVRADIYLKEGERYRNQRQWNEAIALHERARSLDSDEDFYYLMLALDYQLMAQDGNLDAAVRQQAWRQGEEIALTAREINPYNPDNTGNMGRYYFTLGQVFDRQKFEEALDYFEKATTLAPSNVIYHNLWAQTHYIMQNYDEAIDRLKKSVSIDGLYPPTWILLGDTYAAKGDLDQALEAHSQGIQIGGWSNFADQFLDQRLNFYISAGRGDDIIAAMQQVALEQENRMEAATTETARTSNASQLARMQWAIGHAYNLMGQRDRAVTYFEQARTLGDNSERTLRGLANIHLAAEDFEQAEPVYQQLLENKPNDVEAHSALAYIYAQQGRLDEAIMHNQQVLAQSPEDYDTLKNLAILYQQQQAWPEALDAAQRAEAAAPDAEKASWTQFIANIQNQTTPAE